MSKAKEIADIQLLREFDKNNTGKIEKSDLEAADKAFEEGEITISELADVARVRNGGFEFDPRPVQDSSRTIVKELDLSSEEPKTILAVFTVKNVIQTGRGEKLTKTFTIKVSDKEVKELTVELEPGEIKTLEARVRGVNPLDKDRGRNVFVGEKMGRVKVASEGYTKEERDKKKKQKSGNGVEKKKIERTKINGDGKRELRRNVKEELLKGDNGEREREKERDPQPQPDPTPDPQPPSDDNKRVKQIALAAGIGAAAYLLG